MIQEGTLFIVSTPIGNLQDITLRALEVLKSVDLILCEDTRVTVKLLNAYEITKPLVSYHQHSKLSKVEKIIEELESGKNLALVTDAGTPGVSDPGNELQQKLIEHFGEALKIISIPGPSALTALIQVAGINLTKFVFLGFPPHKKGRETFFRKISEMEYPVIYYDSPYRVVKNLQLLKTLANSDKKVVVGRELTKVFEEIKRGSPEEVAGYYETHPDKRKGEFVVAVY